MQFSTISLASVPVLLFSLIVGLSLWTFYQIQRWHAYWAKQGVRGPKGVPMFGVLHKMLTTNRMKVELENIKKYGKIYVEPSFRLKPQLVIADPEVIRQITIKDFDAFTNHNVAPFANQYQKNFLLWLKDDHWKKVRSLMSPTFTSGKIKKMFKFLQVCADDLLEHFQEQLADNKEVTLNLLDIYGLFTMDGITTCGYGIRLKREFSATSVKAAASRNEFIKSVLNVLELDVKRMLAAGFTPGFILKLIGFKVSPDSNFDPLIKRVKDIIRKRREASATVKYDDLLQLLIDAKSDDKMELDELDLAENHHAGLTQESLKKDHEEMLKSVGSKTGGTKLNELELLSEAAFMLVAGMDTTRTLLTNCSYCLAFHPEIQEKLYKELSKIVEHDPEHKDRHMFTYEAITSCHYLDAVISESLRILSPSIKTDRATVRDYFIEKYNVWVPKGTPIMIGIYAVQNDPDNWDKPEVFNPDRFLPENKDKIISGSYIPFSMGPRHCIGMRFSLTEAKIGLAKVMMKYRFAPAEGTVFPPEPAARITLNFLKDPRVKVVARDQ